MQPECMKGKKCLSHRPLLLVHRPFNVQVGRNRRWRLGLRSKMPVLTAVVSGSPYMPAQRSSLSKLKVPAWPKVEVKDLWCPRRGAQNQHEVQTPNLETRVQQTAPTRDPTPCLIHSFGKLGPLKAAGACTSHL